VIPITTKIYLAVESHTFHPCKQTDVSVFQWRRVGLICFLYNDAL